MNDQDLRAEIALLAQVSANVIFSVHALKRMRERGITPIQVLTTLRDGAISEPAHQDIRGDWKCALRKSVAGDLITVAVALKVGANGAKALVITVFVD